jgi:hypothetical protein
MRFFRHRSDALQPPRFKPQGGACKFLTDGEDGSATYISRPRIRERRQVRQGEVPDGSHVRARLGPRRRGVLRADRHRQNLRRGGRLYGQEASFDDRVRRLWSGAIGRGCRRQGCAGAGAAPGSCDPPFGVSAISFRNGRWDAVIRTRPWGCNSTDRPLVQQFREEELSTKWPLSLPGEGLPYSLSRC